MRPALLQALLAIAAAGCCVPAPGCERAGRPGFTATPGFDGPGERPAPDRPEREPRRASEPRLGRLAPEDLVYLGAFRLPPDDRAAGEPASWAYSAQALAYRQDGDPRGPADGHPGSLFVTGHDRHNWVSEIDIPAPARRSDPARLPVARTLQPFRDVRGSLFRGLEEVPRVGMAFVPAGPGRRAPWLYLVFGAHFQEEGSRQVVAPLTRISPDLGRASASESWWVGQAPLYGTNDYLFAVDEAWAAEHVGGRSLAAGRFRDGGWSGMGPSLHAIAPFAEGELPRPGARVPATTLVQYASSQSGAARGGRLEGYHHSDEWNGGAWVVSGAGSAVLFLGTKGEGHCWYGWASPEGDGAPCVEGGVRDSVTCYQPDGSVCPDRLSRHCRAGQSVSYRGWWSSRFGAVVLFYDPDDLARVASGRARPDSPQPYARLDLDEHLLLPRTTFEPMNTGRGEQRRYRLGEPAFDPDRGLLYVPELFADGARPVVHVLGVR